jgi:hypothetical protein
MLWIYGNAIAGGQVDSIASQLQQHVSSFSSISYQAYGVGDDGSFASNHPGGVQANAAETFRAHLGATIGIWPMISSTDSYAPFNKLFSNAQLQENFIQAAIAEAHAHGFSGYVASPSSANRAEMMRV